MLSLEGRWKDMLYTSRRGLHAGLALMVIGLGACDDSTSPPSPGSMVVTTETSGFMKADGYGLVVDGVASGTIGADDEVTIPDLEPGDHQVSLADMPANCAAEDVTVTVVSEQAAPVAFDVVCTFEEPASYNIQFSRERPNLDTGEVTVCPFGICSSQESWDLYVYNSLQSDPHSVIRQNEAAGVEIAHLPGVTLSTLTEADYTGATFTADPISDPFDAGRVILIRTDVGNVFALGDPLEDTTNGRLSFSAALIVRP